ncbi:MAG: SGNH/GDSL hydrolase family protein, partial [Pedobacter sp.]
MKLGAIITYALLLFSFFSPVFVSAQTNGGVSCPEAAQYYAKDSINIVTFGASTVEGVNGLSFQPLLSNNFANCYTGKIINITNQGIGGQTTRQGLLRIDNAIQNRTGFIVLNMGINDAIAMTRNVGSVAETIENMRLLITTSIKQKLVPIICTLQFVDDRTTREYIAINNNIRNINAAYRRLATEYKIYLADVNAAMR